MGNRVASRYVKSLLSLAVEKGVLEQVHDDMVLFDKVCAENRQFKVMLESPVIPHDKKNEILTKLFKGKVHELTLAIFNIITRKNREPLLPAIAREFHDAYNVHKGIGKASVTTAFPLDAELRANFERMAKTISKRDSVEIIERVDKDLIGGYVLNVGDRQIDASLKTKLKRLETTLTENPFVKEF